MGAAFPAGVVLGTIMSGAALYIVHMILKMPVRLEIQWEFLLEYIVCVTVVYFISNLVVALTAIQSQIRTTFKSDSGLLDRSTPPKVKEAKQLTFFACLKRKWSFYRRIYIGRFAISIIIMAVSAICLQYFIEAKNQFNTWMGAGEHAYYYNADQPDKGLTEEQIEELGEINGVKSIEKETYINSSTMMPGTEADESKRVYAYEMDDHAIAPGDTVKISTPWGSREIQVGAVVTDPDAELAVSTQVVEVSEKFVNLLCGFEEPRYMGVKINLDEAVDTARTGEAIEAYFVNPGARRSPSYRCQQRCKGICGDILV